IQELVNIPSPSGFTHQIVHHLEAKLKQHPYHIGRTNKGALLVSTTENPELLITAHVDTLGGMVKYIKDDGTLEITQIGGWPPNSFEGEYVTILTQSDKTIRGTFLINNPAAHVNNKVAEIEREMENMHIRIDTISCSKIETQQAGIHIGDFIFFDPRFEYTETGFIKSRFLDDKACAGILYDILMNHYDEIKTKKVGILFSVFEEVGHGANAGIPVSVKEMLVTDMGVVGDGVEGTETAVSICAKDNMGPYNYEMRQKLTSLAQKNKLPFVVDVFPYYSSDGSQALRAGLDLRIALIGPGISGSHGVERTHQNGIDATKNLILKYINSFENGNI
ncbi:M42 family metallopeptidase, partial [candidate division KSB1 bacterium]|nr:M42 family metallopeptidase [candidate division KSB1 bacterium]